MYTVCWTHGMFRMDLAICFTETSHMDPSNHPVMGVCMQRDGATFRDEIILHR